MGSSSTTPSNPPTADDRSTGLSLAYLELFVADAVATAAELRNRYGFDIVATADQPGGNARSLVLRRGRAQLVATQGIAGSHPARRFVAAHGPGVGDVAFLADDVRSVVAQAVVCGATAYPATSSPSTVADSTDLAAWTIGGFGDVAHTVIDRARWRADGLPPGCVPVSPSPVAATRPGDVLGVDHLAVCLPAGELDASSSFYQQALGFRLIFEERVVVGAQAMRSAVVQNPAGDVTFTLLEPDATAVPGQIDEFLKDHDGAGVQHIAFATDDIVAAVTRAGERGVEFLSTPDAYYERLSDRLRLRRHHLDVLRKLNILADEDEHGQLFQIFTRSTHPRRTMFFELIERDGARTFGSGNIKGLYEAVEQDRR